jgi:hypothetical protein
MQKDVLIARLQNEISVLKSQGLGRASTPSTSRSVTMLGSSSGCGNFATSRAVEKYRRVRDNQTLATPTSSYDPYSMSKSRWDTSNATFKYRRNTPVESSFNHTEPHAQGNRPMPGGSWGPHVGRGGGQSIRTVGKHEGVVRDSGWFVRSGKGDRDSCVR